MTSEVLDVHETRVRALIDGDLETLDQIVADDLTFTTPHGTVLTKRMVFDSVRSGEMKVTRMDVDELVV
ncbi:MAG: nuclear transport factor 2 family protein, partial [Verrucomicrobiota bacterium]|nr:nuclear transport factor 2 family protein [Verrucomicrobiota bacterium]